MGLWVHRLIDKDEDTMSGTCKECGPIDLVWKNGRLKCPTAVREQRGVRPDSESRQPHGLTPTQAREFREGKVCAICGSTDRLVVDHCHERMVIRDVLCASCNLGLGLFGDDPKRLEAAANYLHRHKASA